MIQSLLLRRRSGASLVLVSWLLLTVFSCGALSMMPDTEAAARLSDNVEAMVVSETHHHDMGASSLSGVSHNMPCCDSDSDAMQLVGSCCEDRPVALNIHSGFKVDADLIKQPTGHSVAFSNDEYLLKSIPNASNISSAVNGQDHCLSNSFPRLHVVYCTFID
jgi:hypothetical protein